MHSIHTCHCVKKLSFSPHRITIPWVTININQSPRFSHHSHKSIIFLSFYNLRFHQHLTHIFQVSTVPEKDSRKDTSPSSQIPSLFQQLSPSSTSMKLTPLTLLEGFDNNNKIMYSHHNLVVILSCGYVSATRQVEGRSPNRKSIHMDMERMFQHEQCSCPMRNKIKEVMGNRWARGDARQCFSKVKSCESSHMYTQGF